MRKRGCKRVEHPTNLQNAVDLVHQLDEAIPPLWHVYDARDMLYEIVRRDEVEEIIRIRYWFDGQVSAFYEGIVTFNNVDPMNLIS